MKISIGVRGSRIGSGGGGFGDFVIDRRRVWLPHAVPVRDLGGSTRYSFVSAAEAGASGQINPFRVKEELGSRMIMREHGSFDKAPCRIPEPQKLQTFLDGAGAVLGRVVLLVRDRPASRRPWRGIPAAEL